MDRDQGEPLTIALLRSERHAAKELERSLQCSSAQARRIVKTGKPPAALRLAFRDFLVMLRERNTRRLAELDDAIKQGDYEAMVARAAARRQTQMGGDP